MKNFNFFEKLWEHSRTLRRVGLVLVMCLITITQMWAGGNCGFYGNNTYIRLWVNDSKNVYLNCNGDDVSDLELGVVDHLYLAEMRALVWKNKQGYGNVCKVIMHYGINTSRNGSEGSTYDFYHDDYDYGDWEGSSGDDTNKKVQQFKAYPDGWDLLSGLTPGTDYYLDFMFSIVGSDSNDHDCEPDKDKRDNKGGNYHVHFRVADSKSTFTAGKYLYFDARTLTSWQTANPDIEFYFKEYYYGNDDIGDPQKCLKTNALENWVYYVTVPEGDRNGTVELDRVRPAGSLDDNYYWNKTKYMYACDRANASQNCLVGDGSDKWSDWYPTWSTYCPPMSASTLSDDGTTLNWGGSGTSGSPYLIPTSSTIKVSASSTSALNDANMTKYYLFKNDGSAVGSGSSTNTKTITASSSNAHKHSIIVESYNYYNSTEGTHLASSPIYYETRTPYNISYEKGSASGASGSTKTDVKLIDVNITLRGATFTRTGYTQTAWNTNSAGTGGTNYNLSASYTGNAALTLYPTWTAKTITLTLNPNTANRGTGSNVEVTATYNSVLPNFSKAVPASGYTLEGYYTAANSGKKIINADGSLVRNVSGYTSNDETPTWQWHSENLTLYAHYVGYPSGYIYITDVKATPESGPSASSQSLNYNSGIVDNFDYGSFAGRDYGCNTGASGYYLLTFDPALDLSGYENVKLDLWWGNNTNDTRGYQIYLNDDASALTSGSASAAADKKKVLTVSDVSVSAESISKIKLTGNGGGGNSVFFRVGIKGDAASCSAVPTVSTTTLGTTTPTTQVVNCAGISSLGTGTCTISDYGFVYGTSEDPTVSDNKEQVGTTYTTTNVAFDATTIESLTPGATYYVRAYATNGYGTAYGTGTSFTTHYAITTGSHTNGSVTIPSSAAPGASVAISATPSTGYSFSSWTIKKTSDGSDVTESVSLSGTTSATFTMPDYAVTVDATFSCTTPTITGPSDKTVCKDDDSPELSVSADANGGSLSYQWYSNTANSTTTPTPVALENCTTATYSAASTSSVGTIYYYCVVTNTTGSCSANSDIAAVTVTAPTAISSHPSSIDDAVVGEEQTLTVSATGTGTLTYQWYTCAANGSSESAILVKDNATADDATLAITPGAVGTTYYKCKVHSDCGDDVYSNVASILAKNGISPTLTYANSVTYGSTISPLTSGTWGDGSVTYSLNSVNPANSLSINSSTGVVSGDAAGGTATVTATIAEGTDYWGGSVTSGSITVAKANLSVTATAGEATSVTHNSATLPFELSSTTGVASVTLNVYDASDDSEPVKTVSGVTAATSGSASATGLSASTTYYFTVTPIGDSNHNNGSESDKSATFTTSAAPTLTAISADVLYQAADMANITFTGSDLYWAGFSTNNLFQTYGNGTSSSAKGKTISSTSVTDDISTKNFTSHAYIEGSDVTSGTADPTYGAIEFTTPSTAGLLYVYTVDGSSSNLKLRKKGSSTFTALTGSSNYNAIAVDANSNYYIHGNASKRGIYGIQYVSTYAVTITPTNVTKETGDETAIKGKAYTATFTANDGYELPDDATVTIASSPATKGSEYTWSVTDGTATLTIAAASVTGAISISVSGDKSEEHTITYNPMGGSVDPTSETVTTATLPTPTHASGYSFLGWYTTDGTQISGTYHPTANITLYAKWQGDCAGGGGGSAVLFSQSFNSATAVAYKDGDGQSYTTSSTLSNCVGSGSNLFTSLTCVSGQSSSGIAVNSSSGAGKTDATGVLQVRKKNGSYYWSIIRTSDFAATAPTALKVSMDLWYDNLSSGSNVGVQFAIGADFEDGLMSTSPQSTSNVHSGFNILDNSTAKLAQYASTTAISENGITQETWLSLVWIINNTGSSLTYDEPDGSGKTTLADDKFDIWLKTKAGAINTFTKVVSAQAATTGTKALQNIYIGGNGGSQHLFMLDSIVVTDLNASGSCYTVTYDGNGATSGYVSDPAQYESGTTVYVYDAAGSYTRTGYEFNGWNTTAAGDGEKVSYFTITENTTLFAQWKYVIDSNNEDFAGYDAAPTQYQDVLVTKGATLTLTKSTNVHDITVETGSTLNVSTDGGSAITLATNSLSLVGGWGTVGNETKYDMPRVYIDPASKITKTVKTINFDIAVDNRNFYPIAVPFPVAVRDVNYADAYLAYYALYGTSGQYVIKTYDGQFRANNGSITGCWRVMRDGYRHYAESYGEASETLQPGQGYILRALPANASGWSDEYAIIRFPMKNVDDKWTAAGEKGSIVVDEETVTKNVVPVTAYLKQGDAEDAGDKTPMANRGWNILGVPYMSCYTTATDMGTSAIIKGRFNYETNKWEDGDIRYVTVPTHDFSEYIQANIEDEETPTVLLPGWCFFVQIGTTGNLTFVAADEAASTDLPYRAPKQEQAMPTVKTGIILTGANAKDKTTILVSDKYNAAEYEINADLEKMFGENGYTLATYTLSGETRLAYNAMNNADIMNVIPVGYRAPEEGEYTFSINPRYAESEAFEQVNLIDYEEGVITNLLQSSYSFTTARTQNDARFAINVVKRQDMPTDIENDASGINDANGPRKVLINDKMYIIVDGKMYDATGKAVK